MKVNKLIVLGERIMTGCERRTYDTLSSFDFRQCPDFFGDVSK